ncbi:MAG: (2Fe-2S) ferredoxin domain-containing protein, partial [Cellulomonas sp.]|nr:(2Fe-2S) ferredoxin domain-containing protein [Cellulomonas sp.]
MSETTVRAITTADDLDAMRDDYLERTKDVTLTVMLCSGASCLSSQADEIEDALARELTAAGLSGTALVKHTGC